jgi:hypothetical protein
MKAEGVVGMMQDFLVEEYAKVVGDDGFMIDGVPQGDGLIEFLFNEASDVIDAEADAETQLQEMRLMVANAIDDLQALQAGLYANVPDGIKRLMASQAMSKSLDGAMGEGDSTVSKNSFGPSPM